MLKIKISEINCTAFVIINGRKPPNKASPKITGIMHPVFATLRGANGWTGGMPSANAL
jgi:hypothetical protein